MITVGQDAPTSLYGGHGVLDGQGCMLIGDHQECDIVSVRWVGIHDHTQVLRIKFEIPTMFMNLVFRFLVAWTLWNYTQIYYSKFS